MPILCRISQIEAKGIEGYYDTNPLGDNNIMAKDELRMRFIDGGPFGRLGLQFWHGLNAKCQGMEN